jgi:hypothetical protein
MKHNMKKTGLFILSVCTFLMSGNVQSQTLYIYSTSAPAPSEYALDDVEKLSFTETDMVIQQTAGTGTVSLATLRYFNLVKSGTTDIAPVKPAETLAFFDASGTLIIRSGVAVTSVTLSGVQGQTLLLAAPNAANVALPAAAYPAGIYLLQFADGNGNSIRKIIKK